MAFDDSVAPQKITVAFSGPIDSSTLSASDLFLQSVTGAEPNPLATSVSYNSTSHVATFTITNGSGGVLADGNYRASLVGEDVKDTNGDAVTGSGYRDFFYLTGDVNNSREVDDSDLYITQSNQDSPGNRYNGDADYSTYVDWFDIEVAGHHYGSSLPAPPIIGTITAGNQTSSSMELNWVDSVNGEAGWRVQRSADGANFDWYINLPANTTTYTDPALTDGSRYWWRVRAYGNGQDTAYTPKQGGTTLLPGPQQNVSMEKSSTTASIAWEDNSQNETSFDIDVSTDGGTTWSLATSVGANTTFTDISGLSPGTDYVFRVQARNAQTTSADTPGAAVQPAPPTDVIATAAVDGVVLNWTDNSARDTGYAIERTPASTPSDFTQVGQVGANVTSFTDTTAAAWVAYLYRVHSTTSDATSVWSDPVLGISGRDQPPNGSTGVATFDYNIPAIKIQFTEDLSGLSAEDLVLTPIGVPNAAPLPTTLTYDSGTKTATFATGLLPNGNYHAVLASGSVPGLDEDIMVDFFVLAGDANHDRTVDVTDLGILATHWQGAGTFSQGDFNYDGQVDVSDLGILATNWQLKLTPVSANALFTDTVFLGWAATDGNSQYYEVFRDTTPNFVPSFDNLIGMPSDPAWYDNTVAADTQYYYQVFAVVDVATSAVVGAMSITTPSDDPPVTDPDASVTSVLAIGVNDLEILVTWTPPVAADFDRYRVEVSADQVNWSVADLVPTNATSCLVRGYGADGSQFMSNSSNYFFRVAGAARDGTRQGPWSTPATATTLPPLIDIDAGQDLVLIVTPFTWTLEKSLSGVTINNTGSGPLLGGLTAKKNGTALIWADLVNEGYNAYLVPDPRDGGSYGVNGAPNSYKELADGSRLYSALNNDGSGRIYDEMTHELNLGAYDLGLIGWSYGAGMTEIISNRLFNDLSIPFLSRVVVSETIDGIKYNTQNPMTAAPATQWGGFANNYYTDKGPPGLPNLHGRSFASATNYGPLSWLDHGTIGVNASVLSSVEIDVDNVYGQLSF